MLFGPFLAEAVDKLFWPFCSARLIYDNPLARNNDTGFFSSPDCWKAQKGHLRQARM